MKILALSLLSIALILESSLTTLPLVFLVLLALMAYLKNNYIFGLGVIFGALLDLLTLQTIGLSSIFFVVFLFFVLLYQSKLEIKTNTFILLASLIGSILFFVFTGLTASLILKSIVSSGVGLAIFLFISFVSVSKKLS